MMPGQEQPPPIAVVRGLYRLSRWTLVAALACVLVFTVAQVLDRYIFKSAFNAHDQYARMGLVLLTFVGIAEGIRDRVNVRVEVLSHFAPLGVQRFVAAGLDLVTMAMAGLLTWVGLRLLEIGASQPILGTPFTYQVMYVSLLVGMGLLAVFLLLRFATRLSGGRLRLDLLPD